MTTTNFPSRFLAIDPGTRCGYALYQDGAPIAAGVWDLSPRRHEGGGMRYVRLRGYLDEVGRVDQVGYEEVRHHKGVDASQIYGGIVMCLTGWCEMFNSPIPYQGIPVKTIKKHATSKGNSNKNIMIEACEKRLKVIPVDDNEADARWILDYMMYRTHNLKAHAVGPAQGLAWQQEA